MKMFLLLLLLFTILSMNLINAGLSPEERSKLIKAINEDRARIASKIPEYKFPPLEYNETLEKELDSHKYYCLPVIGFKLNKIGYDYSNKSIHIDRSYKFFDRRNYTIGCSKTFKCTEPIDKNAGYLEEFDGMTIVKYGGCLVKGVIYEELFPMKEKLLKAGMPPMSKYADFLGVTESSVNASNVGNDKVDGSSELQGSQDTTDTLNSSGKVFNLIIFLFLVFYV